MDDISKDDVINALREVIQETLLEGEVAHIPGLGTFSLAHRPSETESLSSGVVVMRPPHTEIVFTPEA